MNIDYLKKQLARHEGDRPDLYDDADGKSFKTKRTVIGHLTCGIGRNIEENGISEDEAQLMLANDINKVIKDLNDHIAWWNSLDEARSGVLANLCFNMGISRLLQFQLMLAALQTGDYTKAADEMVNSAWYKETGVRALELVNQMRTGDML
jgi:lysozyme